MFFVHRALILLVTSISVVANSDFMFAQDKKEPLPEGGRVMQGPEGHVVYVAFSPDARYAVSATRGAGITVWGAGTGEAIKRIPPKGKINLYSAVLTPDGKRIVTWSYGSSGIEMWDLESGEQVKKFKTIRDFAVAIHPNGKQILAHASDEKGDTFYEHVLIDIESEKEIRRFKLPRHPGAQPPIGRGFHHFSHLATFAPDGKHLLAGTVQHTRINEMGGRSDASKGLLILWDVATGREVRRLEKSGTPAAAAFTPDSKRLVTVNGVDGTGGGMSLRIWESGREVNRLLNVDAAAGSAGDPGSYLACSSDGKYVFSSVGTNKAIGAWDLNTSKLVHEFKGGPGFSSVAVSQDGKWVLGGGGLDGRVWLWPMPDSIKIEPPPEPKKKK